MLTCNTGRCDTTVLGFPGMTGKPSVGLETCRQHCPSIIPTHYWELCHAFGTVRTVSVPMCSKVVYVRISSLCEALDKCSNRVDKGKMVLSSSQYITLKALPAYCVYYIRTIVHNTVVHTLFYSNS